MQVNITDAVNQTNMFLFLGLLLLLLTLRKNDSKGFFDVSLTQELKGFAILAVILSHIGYFLVTDHRFLFPLTISAGVAVNLFLFLSGYGLTMSELKHPSGVLGFYKKRLPHIFIPFWLIITVFFLTDKLFLNISYPAQTILQAYVGLFNRAEVLMDFNSPLWYFTFILFYYLFFPLLFMKKFPYSSVLAFGILGVLVMVLRLPVDKGVLNLYSLHLLAFPLGVLFAEFFHRPESGFITHNINKFVNFSKRHIQTITFFRLLTLGVLALLFGYFSINAGIGKGVLVEQPLSLLTMGILVLFFMLKGVKIDLLYWFGVYSYEIYLFHWPLLYRYDFLYGRVPASLATFIYLTLFLVIGFLLNKAVGLLLFHKRVG